MSDAPVTLPTSRKKKAVHRDREHLDFYPTPLPLCRAIVKTFEPFLPKLAPILEPSCGSGNFLVALKEIGCIDLLAVDCDPAAPGLQMVPPGSRWISKIQDLPNLLPTMPHPRRPLVCIGNPPFKEAQQHLEWMLRHRNKANTLIIQLLRLNFLEGQKRYASFWKEHPPQHLLVLPKRPSFKWGGTDRTGYAVFCWAPDPLPGIPVLSWLEWNT